MAVGSTVTFQCEAKGEPPARHLLAKRGEPEPTVLLPEAPAGAQPLLRVADGRPHHRGRPARRQRLLQLPGRQHRGQHHHQGPAGGL
ncbi:hypothetical protein ANANG_G00165480 [Anguilla anguilla]|uniref:Uncharacterized protein n=1 Tax=Anguilla anguilla TaxID=7936 RepID=A0A9D3MAR2_ANGAN|nr:hypothetical protein ANANG_G00165480 [Anguilla anguilla]